MTAPFTIENDRPTRGGQVPLLKHACMAWLQKNRGDNGRIHGDSYNIAADTRASISNVLRALWDLQKMGLITFRERKRAGTNGHASTSVLTHFELTPKGLEWTADKAVVDDLTTVPTNTWDDLNPAYVSETDVEDVADEMKDESRQKALDAVHAAVATMPPVVALERVLRFYGKPMHIIRELNPVLGYFATSTAIYSLVRKNPEAFHIKGGYVHLDAPEGWKPAYEAPSKGAPRKDPLLEEARASVALDGETQVVESTPISDEIDAAFSAAPQLELGPEIRALMDRAGKRVKVAEAIAILEAAGLEEDALSVMTRIPDDTPLEQEVIALVKRFGA